LNNILKQAQLKKFMKCLVIYEKSETGYSAYVVDLPGCIATAPQKKRRLKI
jgi:hypothetical protein